MNIALCGLATIEKFSNNGEANIVRNLCSALKLAGHKVGLFGVGEALSLPLGISKLALAVDFSYDYYYSKLQPFKPDVCIIFTDFDFSSIKVAKDMGAKVIMSVNMHHCVCPLWTAFDWNSEYCTKASFHRCAYHVLRSFNDQLITGPMDPITARLFNALKLAIFFSNRDLVKLADVFIAPSRGIVEELSNAGIPKEKIRLIRNGIDLNRWKPAENHRSKDKIVLYYSFPSIEKGGEFYVNLAEKFNTSNYKNVKFLMLKSKFYGKVPSNVEEIPHRLEQGNEIVDQVRRAYLVVVPSIWEDPSPFVCGEAMSAGKPVIGFDTMGLRDQIVDGKTGFLVKNMNLEELYLKTKELLDNKELAVSMGIQARRRAASQFDLKRAMHEYSQVIEQAMET